MAESEIYQFRAGAGEYPPQLPRDKRAAALALRLKNISDYVTSAAVKGSGFLDLRAVELARANGFRRSQADDGFSRLTHDDYVALRLERVLRQSRWV
jgi:hypothetical protein